MGKVFFLALFSLFMQPLAAAHFENMIDLTIRIEDAGFNLKIKDFKFNGQEVKLDDSDNFKPRKVVEHRLEPGRYMITWSTEKARGQAKWATDGPVNHEKILVLESGDTAVKVNVKGDTITLY